ncbi:MAG: D-amino acid dehydrogenase [Rubrivivax sp.]
MRIAVIGAGIIGVTTAYELAADGHELTVFERNAHVAGETSFANAGVIAPGYVTPWAAPGMPWKVMRGSVGKHAAVRFGGLDALTHLPWMYRWWRACRPAVYRANRGSMHALARYSAQRLNSLRQELKLDYERANGYLVLLRGKRERALAEASMDVLRQLEVPFDMLDAGQCRLLEPGLSVDTPLHSAIGLPRDEVGNCRQFAQLLAAEARLCGARFEFGQHVVALKPGIRPLVSTIAGSADTAHRSAQRPVPAVLDTEFDAVVVCAGPQANALLAPLGCKLPIVSVHGYSITAPLQHHDGGPPAAPLGAVMDEKYKVAISRLGQRVRVAGSAEIGGPAQRFNPAALRTLYKVLDDWFPGAARLSQAQRWKGARPMLPDGPPVLGRSTAAGIWMNLGHGSSGWALACGSARALADLVGQREPEIDTSGLSPARLTV